MSQDQLIKKVIELLLREKLITAEEKNRCMEMLERMED